MKKKVAKEPSEVLKARQRRKRKARKENAAEEKTDEVAVEGSPAEPSLKRPRRKQKANVRLADYVVGNVLIAEEVSIPTTYKQAHACGHSPQRKAAMLAELQKTAKNVKAITCCWVFAVKQDERGRVKRFKARLVIHGFKQQQGVNYNETYAPVRGGAVRRQDCVLVRDLEELIFMVQPPGCQVDGQNYICRLLKSLYGLKRPPNIWNKTLHAKLMMMGFTRTDSDYGLYVLMENGEIKLLLTVYVDDLLLMGPRAKCAKIAALLQKTFELTTMGTVKYLLGVEIMIDRLRRQIYVVEVLKRFHMENCNGCATPEVTSPSKADVPTTTAYLPYRELVGALQYLVSASRPDIAHATRHLGKYLSSYDHTHYVQAKRVLRYLKSTCDYGLVMDVQMQKDVRICSYADAHYANDPVDRRSISE
ncbi:Integrase, catalytic core protein [Phytophthora megakarya]|uniref:Integrase, catalytic core protein n=1 Tax=Phytophthora megakarya TaxID=4795 RepID=A0A225WBB4_9STRA|nr:Integrase, catalytic core protein [Phytophthora megakarya]